MNKSRLKDLKNFDFDFVGAHDKKNKQYTNDTLITQLNQTVKLANIIK